jgi:hypothetical protein
MHQYQSESDAGTSPVRRGDAPCAWSTANVLALQATVLLLLTLLIKAKIRITAFSALGFFLLILQTLVFLAISGGLVLAAGGAAIYSTQKRRPVAG